MHLMVHFDGSGRTGYDFVVSFTGGTQDAAITNENNFNTDRDGNWQQAVSENVDGWTVEMLIPWYIAPMHAAHAGRCDARMSHMIPLRYLQAYPDRLQDKVRELIAQERLGEHLSSRYPDRHDVQSDKALYAYTVDLKQRHLRNAPGIDKVLYDAKLDVVRNALGLHTAISRVQGGRLKAKKEIRVASLFKAAAPQFLQMIVVHELAHLKETEHDKAFYQLCTYMLADYHQLEFDLRVYLTWRELPSTINADNRE